MKPCIHRIIEQDRIRCLNTVDLIHKGYVTEDVCNACPYATDSPIRGLGDVVAAVAEKTGIKSIVKKISNSCGCDERQDSLNTIFTPRKFRDSRWAVAVTTCPRPEPTLSCCVASLRNAGWEPTVFAEPDSIELPNVSYRHNPMRLGAWHNWLKTCNWFLNETDAEFFLSVQDDSYFHPDSRSFTEGILWPSHRTGFISLYTAKHYSMNRSNEMLQVGVNKIVTSSFWGACALVFHRNVIKLLLNHSITKTWSGCPPQANTIKERNDILQDRKKNPHKIQNVDTAISKIMKALVLEMYVVDPSPVTHIAEYSSIGHGSNTNKRNCFRCADRTKPLFEQVFPNRKK